MSVDRDEIERIARLARLDLGDDEVGRLTEDMNRVLELAERLRAAGAGSPGITVAEAAADVMTSGSPDRHRTMDTAPPRPELPDALVAHPSVFAPRWEAGFFVVPPPPGVQVDEDA